MPNTERMVSHHRRTVYLQGILFFEEISSNIYNATRVTILLNYAEGKIYSPCELASKLAADGIPRNEIPTYVCISKHESDYNTNTINHNTGDYGIFQISSIYWCNPGDTPGKACDVSCNQLLDGDISDDIKCIKKIYTETEKEKGNGFEAWTTYEPYCKNSNNEDYVKGCNY